MNVRANDRESAPNYLSQARVLALFGEFSGRTNPGLDYDWDLDRPSMVDDVHSPEELARLLRTTHTYDAMRTLIKSMYGLENPGFNRYFIKHPRPGVAPKLTGGHNYTPEFEGSYLEATYNEQDDSFSIIYGYPEHAANNPEIRYQLQIFPDTIKDLRQPETSFEDLVINTKHAIAHFKYHLGLSVTGA